MGHIFAMLGLSLGRLAVLEALECHQALLLGQSLDYHGGHDMVAAQCGAVSSTAVNGTLPPIVELIDALCSSQIILLGSTEGEVGTLPTLVALCPHELVVLTIHTFAIASELGFSPCDIDEGSLLACWYLPDALNSKKPNMIEVTVETTATSALGFELGMSVPYLPTVSAGGRDAYALEVAVNIRIDGATDHHAVVPHWPDPMHAFIEVNAFSLSLPTHIPLPA